MMQPDIFDNELMEALHQTFAAHLKAKQDMPAQIVICSLLGYVVSELAYCIVYHPDKAEETKESMVATFIDLLNAVKPETKH